jgi:inner membrane protein
MLHRGIYDAAVFRAQVTLSGKFAAPDFGPLKVDVKDLQWKDAFVTIAVNDLRGTREALMLDWGGAKHPLLPGSQVPGYTTGVTASLGTDQPIASETEFSIPLDFNGSEGIYFAPFGVQNEATLKSNWPDPAFRCCVFACGTIGAPWRIRWEMEGVVLRSRLSAIVDESHRQ